MCGREQESEARLQSTVDSQQFTEDIRPPGFDFRLSIVDCKPVVGGFPFSSFHSSFGRLNSGSLAPWFCWLCFFPLTRLTGFPDNWSYRYLPFVKALRYVVFVLFCRIRLRPRLGRGSFQHADRLTLLRRNHQLDNLFHGGVWVPNTSL